MRLSKLIETLETMRALYGDVKVVIEVKGKRGGNYCVVGAVPERGNWKKPRSAWKNPSIVISDC